MKLNLGLVTLEDSDIPKIKGFAKKIKENTFNRKVKKPDAAPGPNIKLDCVHPDVTLDEHTPLSKFYPYVVFSFTNLPDGADIWQGRFRRVGEEWTELGWSSPEHEVGVVNVPSGEYEASTRVGNKNGDLSDWSPSVRFNVVVQINANLRPTVL